MYGRTRITLGNLLLLAFLFFGVSLYFLLSGTYLLWQGVTTQGVIVAEQDITCSKKSTTWQQQMFSVQFTDQAGQTQIGTIGQCGGYVLDASPGDSVAIVYLPTNPTMIAPLDDVIPGVQFFVFSTISTGLITLVLLAIWIRERSRKASLSTL